MSIEELVQACILLKEGEKKEYTMMNGILILGLSARINKERTDGLKVLLKQAGNVVTATCSK